MPKIQKGLSLLEIEIWRSLFVIYGFSKSHSFTPVHIGVFVDEFPLNQMDIFQLVGAPFVENCLAVFNSSIFAYGQTGSGKTYTIWGPGNALLEENSSIYISIYMV